MMGIKKIKLKLFQGRNFLGEHRSNIIRNLLVEYIIICLIITIHRKNLLQNFIYNVPICRYLLKTAKLSRAKFKISSHQIQFPPNLKKNCNHQIKFPAWLFSVIFRYQGSQVIIKCCQVNRLSGVQVNLCLKNYQGLFIKACIICHVSIYSMYPIK